MANPPADLTPLAREEELLVPFVSAQKPEQKLGAEMEKFGVTGDGTPIDYDGPAGVLRFFEELQREGHWEADRELAGGPILALLKDGASITLEPGSQFELSGAQHDSVHQVADEIVAHMGELAPLSRKLGVRWLGLGFHPFAKRADYKFVPKKRYAIMREYLPTRGSLALDMMLRTSTVQVNFDYVSEKDAMKKLRVGQALAPLTTALFANSPFYEGAPFGGKSYRAKVWLDMDPDRSGLLPRLFEDDASYGDYVQWALDCPMFLVKRDDRFLANAGQSFRDFWKNGFEGERATQGDWQLHLNTLFPEVRLKRTIEVRGADSQNAANAPALSRVVCRHLLRRAGAGSRVPARCKLHLCRGRSLPRTRADAGPRGAVPRRVARGPRPARGRDRRGRTRAPQPARRERRRRTRASCKSQVSPRAR